MIKLVSLEAVHTHTHTHTSNLIDREVKNKVADATTLFIVNMKSYVYLLKTKNMAFLRAKKQKI